MKIGFHLAWEKPGPVSPRSFKSKEAWGLFQDYISRIEKFSSCEIRSGIPERNPGLKLWLCSPSSANKPVSSEDLARRLDQNLLDSTKSLGILIGGADGLESSVRTIKPDWIWNFGPLTFPHELACVLAAEQIYRSWTILKKLPYHLGH